MTSMRTTFALLAALSCFTSCRAECLRVDACSCRDQETGELVSLYQLANRQGNPGLQVTNGTQVYEFNPCLNITAPVCRDVAFCQHSTSAQPGQFNTLGLQSSVQFIGSPESEQFLLQLQSNGQQWQRRTTLVNLICDHQATAAEFVFVEQHQQSRTFVFNLTSQCACAGGCRPPPEQCTPDPINKCSCHLSGDDDLVNMQSIDDPSAPLMTTFVYNNKTAEVFFNPCTAMSGGPAACHGATSCVQFEGEAADIYGVSPTQFRVDIEGNPIFVYSDESLRRFTFITLVCDYSARHAPNLTVRAYAPNSVLDLELRSMCACPGACVEPPLTCDPVDDCTCKISEDVGTVSLRQLDTPSSPLMYHVTSSGQGYTFLYNPCSNFSAVGRNHQCLNVSGCQFNGQVSEDDPDNSLGLQPTAQFRVSQEGVVTVTYSGGSGGRHFSVVLLCNKAATVPLLTVLDHNIGNFVHMQLESQYACPMKAL